MVPDENPGLGLVSAKKMLALKVDSGEERKSQDEVKIPSPKKARSLKGSKKPKVNLNAIAKLKGAV